MHNQTKILLVDDEKDIIEFLEYNLMLEGFRVISAFNGKEALEKLSQEPDLIILDVMMPKMDGYEVCVKIRSMEEYKNIPVIFLTAKSSEIDEVHGLNLGANDFIQKPISPKKLIARVKSNLRRSGHAEVDSNYLKEIKVGPLRINKERFTIYLDEKEIFFPKKEFEILAYLSANRGKVFPRKKLLEDIWEDDVMVVDRTVDVHIRKIREKLGKYNNLIETIKGVGYRFKIDK